MMASRLRLHRKSSATLLPCLFFNSSWYSMNHKARPPMWRRQWWLTSGRVEVEEWQRNSCLGCYISLLKLSPGRLKGGLLGFSLNLTKSKGSGNAIITISI
jgi:hypothetical protein